MARIRTVKPEFFRHHGLYLAEVETGLPLRIAFAGLWTACDRRGRFKWKPEELKLDCLPHDELDFSRVLHALGTRGFIVRYPATGEYGAIPSFERHQVINNREGESSIPEPFDLMPLPDASPTRDARVPHASPTRHDLDQGEGKGREGKGREELPCPPRGDGVPVRSSQRPSKPSKTTEYSADFVRFWNAYPRKDAKPIAFKAYRRANSDANEQVLVSMVEAIKRQKTSDQWMKDGGQFIPMPATWLNARRWEDEATATPEARQPGDDLPELE